ncbi:hypothetical protein N2W54_004706 [Lotmaria passim]
MLTGDCAVEHCAQCSAVDYTSCMSCSSGYRLTMQGICTRRRNAAAAPASTLTALAAIAVAAMAAMQ